MNKEKMLFTGGKGLLATHLKVHFPDGIFVDVEEFDITNPAEMDSFLSAHKVRTIVHCAAYTLVPKAEQNPDKLININIVGTANVVNLCIKYGIKLVYISTDYVFDGKKGMYKEDDPVFPVNKYAWSKLGGECSARLYDNSLIIRTTFGPDIFQYPAAFIDQWTSREGVSVISKKIADLINKDVNGVFHVGGRRKTVFEYAKALDPSKDIKQRSIKELNVILPVDTSLDTTKYASIIDQK
ncbi:MAG: sugar nucleotide-binding protein [Candidatus Margulisiibacteriota bacterium]